MGQADTTDSLFDLIGRVAIVTGGYGVLGGTIAEGLVEAGASVAILGRNREAASAKVAALQPKLADGAKGHPLIADATDEIQLKSARDEALEVFGAIDILINAAGGNVGAARTDNVPVFGLPFDAFDEVVRLNLHGSVYPSLVFGEAIAQREKGSIVNISSMASMQAISGVLGYSAAKAAIDNVTKWMAVDLARRHGDGLRVNAVAPGFFITKQNRDVLLNEDGSYTDRSAAIIGKTPMKRFGEPEELVGPIVWLCSDAASFVTGTVIPVDGGFSADSGI
ncbi:MAG: SDR family oxidoreductase [Candidatus Latescibacterota bacterium]|jgi:NAD(P)-dependent dehydrogenase (short-subunit alcohol dehydrogenase family)